MPFLFYVIHFMSLQENTYYAQVGNLIGEPHDRSVNPNDWAAKVNKELTENGGNISFVKSLAEFFLTNLVIACKVQCNIRSQ